MRGKIKSIKNRIISGSLVLMLIMGSFPEIVYAKCDVQEESKEVEITQENGSSAETKKQENVFYIAEDGSKIIRDDFIFEETNEESEEAEINTAQEDVEKSFTYTELDGEITVDKYIGQEEKVSVPANINGCPVTKIGNQAFRGCDTIMSLRIPYGVKEISSRAFENCSNLKELYFNCSLERIENSAFNGCNQLEIIYIGSQVSAIWRNSNNMLYGPAVKQFIVDEKNAVLESKDGVIYYKDPEKEGKCRLILYPVAKQEEELEITDDVTNVTVYSICGNSYLKTIKLNSLELKLADEAILNLPRLETLILDGSFSNITTCPFRNCNNLNLVDIQTDISTTNYLFSNCANVARINIGKNVSNYEKNKYPIDNLTAYSVDEGNLIYFADEGVLYKKENKKTLVHYPPKKRGDVWNLSNDVNEIEKNAFSNIAYLKELNMKPSSDIDVQITNCDSIERLSLGGNIKNANIDLAKLKALYLGKKVSLINIEDMNRSNLAEITVDQENPNYVVEDDVLYDKNQQILYWSLTKKACETFVVANTVKEIKRYAFGGCAKVQSVEIPEEVEIIGNRAIDATIIGVKGSEAERYANENGLPFIDKNEKNGAKGSPIVSNNSINVWDGETVTEVIPKGNQYFIQNASQLAWVAKETVSGNDFSGKTIILTADLDLNGKEWTPIGDTNGRYPFRGNFDGRNHVIRNFKVTKGGYSGLFAGISSKKATKTVTIKNLKLEKVDIKNTSSGGAVAAYARAYKGAGIVIENCTVDGKITGEITGGLLGEVIAEEEGANIYIKGIVSTCTLPGNQDGGGIVGKISAGNSEYKSAVPKIKIENCKYRGKINCRYSNGGIVGYLEAIESGNVEVEHCMAEGSITGGIQSYAGGIVGHLCGKNVLLKSCVNYASVMYGYYNGGIAGYSEGMIEECYNEGVLYTNILGGICGGIVGELRGEVSNSYNMGNVFGGNFTYAGGITSYNYGALENCYNIGELPEDINTIVLQQHPGAMGSVVKGETIHCYYAADLVKDPKLYGQPGEQDDPLIYSDATNKIVASGGMTSAAMKIRGSYVNWDFVGIWSFDHNYSYGYPTLNSIKDFLKQHPDTEKKKIKDKEELFTITVVDQNVKEIKDAEVTVGSSEIPVKTNEAGIVKIDFSKDVKGLKVEKEGYITYTDPQFIMNSKKEYTVRIMERGEQGKYPLNSVIMDLNGNRYELLTQTKSINRKLGNIKFELYCTPSDLEKKYTKYEVMQGDTVIAESTDGKFVLTPKQFQVTKKGINIQPTQIRLTDFNGKSYKECVNLTVSDEDRMTSSLQFGENIEFTVGSDVPLFGNTKVKLKTVKIPVSVTVDEEKWRVAVNIADVNSNEEEIIKIFRSKNSLMDQLNKLKKYLKDPSVELCTSPEVTVELVGFAEGDVPLENNEITLNLYAKISTKFLNETQAGVFVFAMEIKGEATATGEIKLNPQSAKIIDGSLKSELSIDVGAYVGFGAAYLFSSGIYGEGKWGMSYNFLPQAISGVEEITLSGEMKTVLRCFGSNIFEHRFLGPGYYVIYSRAIENYTPEVKKSSGGNEPIEQWIQSLGESEITKVTEEAAGEWTGDKEVLQQSAYSESSPLYMKVGSDQIMLFTSNTLTNRSDADRSVLMYSVYDPIASKWNDPKPVSDDGTADFNPVVAGNYVAWNNSKTSLVNCTTINEIGKQQEISVATYNSTKKAFENVQTLTNNDVFENNLDFTENNGKLMLSWTVNSENEVFAGLGTNDLYISTLSDKNNWDTKKVVTIDSMILSKAAGIIDDRKCYGYIIDENGNLNDNEGQVAYLVYEDTGEKIRLSDSGQSVNNVGYLKQQNKIIWIGSDGNIYSKTGGNGTTVKETEEGNINGKLEDIIEDESGNATLLFVKNADNCANAYAVMYDATTGKWSGLVNLTNEENAYVENVSGEYINGKLAFCYNRREVSASSDDLNGKNSIGWKNLKRSTVHFTDIQVEYDESQIHVGEKLPIEISVKNIGIDTCKAVNVKIMQDKKVVLDQKIETIIAAGEKGVITLDFTVPSINTKTKYQISVTAEGDENETIETTIELGAPVYRLERTLYAINGNYKIVASLTNVGISKGSGTIEIFDYDDQSKIYAQYSFKNLASDEVLNYDTILDMIDWSQIAYKKIGIRVVSEGKVVSDIRSVVMYPGNEIKIDSVMLNEEKIKFEAIGETEQLIASVFPENGNVLEAVWTSSNEQVAKVDNTGKVEAVGEGEAEIRVIIGGKEASCMVSVNKALKGDVNGDGLVNLSDAIALLNKVTAQEAIDLTVGDINGDGTVNLQDAIALLNLVTQGEN